MYKKVEIDKRRIPQKRERDVTLYELRRAGRRFTDIAKDYNLSCERVRQIFEAISRERKGDEISFRSSLSYHAYTSLSRHYDLRDDKTPLLLANLPKPGELRKKKNALTVKNFKEISLCLVKHGYISDAREWRLRGSRTRIKKPLPPERVCNHCKELLPITSFYEYSERPGYRQYTCKKCRSEGAAMVRIQRRTATVGPERIAAEIEDLKGRIKIIRKVQLEEAERKPAPKRKEIPRVYGHVTERICRECLHLLPVREFYPSNTIPGGYMYVCRKCQSIREKTASARKKLRLYGKEALEKEVVSLEKLIRMKQTALKGTILVTLDPY